jgi:hypothetical protein
MNLRHILSAVIGSSFFLFAHVATFTAPPEPQVQMYVRDAQGEQVKQLGVAVPYTLEVVITNVQGEIDDLVIQNSNEALLHRQGVTRAVNSINGVSTSKLIYRYSLRFDRQGSYTIGPARVRWSGVHLESPKITVLVSKAVKQKQSSNDVQLQLIVDTPDLVVGESTQFRIRFFSGVSAGLSHIAQPTFEQFDAKPFEGPYAGTEDQNGTTANYLEWVTQLVPKEEGTFVIPAIVGEYKVPRRHGSMLDDDFFGGLFSHGSLHKTITSNPVEIHVNPLPENPEPIAAVGQFTDLKLFIDQKAVKEGEGVVLRLELEG